MPRPTSGHLWPAPKDFGSPPAAGQRWPRTGTVAPAATTFTDSFNTDQTGLPSPWVIHSGSWAIESGKAVLTATALADGTAGEVRDGVYHATRPDIGTTGSTIEVAVDVQFPAAGVAAHGALFWSRQDNNNLWMLRVDQTATAWEAYLRKYDAGSRSVDLYISGLTIPASRAARFSATHNRSTGAVTCYQDGVSIGTATHAGLTSGRQGMGVDGGIRNTPLDNYNERVV